MDVKSGTTVGFITVVGGLGGAIVGFLAAETFNLKHPDRITQAVAALGALTGAFVGGTIVAAPAPMAPPAPAALPAPAPAALTHP
jgi:hypothetical protein